MCPLIPKKTTIISSIPAILTILLGIATEFWGKATEATPSGFILGSTILFFMFFGTYAVILEYTSHITKPMNKD